MEENYPHPNAVFKVPPYFDPPPAQGNQMPDEQDSDRIPEAEHSERVVEAQYRERLVVPQHQAGAEHNRRAVEAQSYRERLANAQRQERDEQYERLRMTTV